MKLFKDYDVTIQYHPGKVNVVGEALSTVAVKYGKIILLDFNQANFCQRNLDLRVQVHEVGNL